MAPSRPQSSTCSASVVGRSSIVTNEPMVLATAVPPISGPSTVNVPTSKTDWAGEMALEATNVEIMLEAS